MTTSISSFTQAASQAQQWVDELVEDLNWSERHAYHLLRTVLQALRDWQSQEEMADLAAQLPLLIRGIYFEGWDPSLTPVRERKKEDFIARIQSAFPGDMINNPERAIEAIFRLLDRHVPHGGAAQVRNSLRKSSRELRQTD